MNEELFGFYNEAYICHTFYDTCLIGDVLTHQILDGFDSMNSLMFEGCTIFNNNSSPVNEVDCMHSYSSNYSQDNGCLDNYSDIFTTNNYCGFYFYI